MMSTQQLRLAIFLFTVTFLFQNCSKKESSVENSSTINFSLIEEIENLPNSIVSLGYNKLKNNEKVEFWNRHVTRYLKTHEDLDKKTIAHINKLKSFLNIDLYDNASSESMQRYVKDFEKKWLLDAVEKEGYNAKTLIEVATLWGAGKQDVTLENMSNIAFKTNSEDPTNSNCNCYYSLPCLPKSCNSKPECSPGNPNPGDCGVFGTSRCTGTCE